MGYLLALIPALGWGFQSIVMQKIGGKFTNKVMGMAMTTFVFAVIIFFFKHPTTVNSNLIIGSFLCGLFWIVGQLLQVKAFDLVGVSMAMPVSTGEQLLGTTLMGALYFHEWQSGWQFILGIGALAFIIVGIYLTTYSNEKKEKNINLKSGLIVLTISSLGLIGYAVIPRIFDLNSWDILLPQSIAMLITMFIIAGVQKNRKILDVKTWQNMVTGIFFAIANIAILFSNEVNGVAVGYTLSQLNVIVATLGGLLILHEKKSKRELFFTLIGLVLIVVGAIMIGATKE
ncbi:GRP family sugar transporter [Companilactobacillus kimchii]|nr:GRP family sugar transporter [Companilactobacillus kimchii]KAE9562201.1 glucose transporter GlcU [Companilactobacillus kimchii]OWF34340.1 putative glucose uptake protein GlcU [Companilactobacillus kimchii]GEO46261.1 glucose uptake protein [Companilactobacillus paralimentarius]